MASLSNNRSPLQATNLELLEVRILPLISRNSNLSVKNKMLSFTSYLRLILTCPCMVLSYAAKSYVKLLIKAQNSTIRQILDMPWYIRNFHIYKKN